MRILKGLAVVVGLAAAFLLFALYERKTAAPEAEGVPNSTRVDPAFLEQRRDAASAGSSQILFGDLHMHSTFSLDAFVWGMPSMQGRGEHPPAEACDYARYCSGLDFFAATDHAEALTPSHWQMVKSAVRACNASAGPADNPDVVSFLGWEWTQMGNSRDTHFGHRNVMFLNTAEDRVPMRPIAAGGVAVNAMRNSGLPWLEDLLQPYFGKWSEREMAITQINKLKGIKNTPLCPQGVPTRQLSADCMEVADTPADLYAKLDDWGFESLVIPHGTSWGFYTPPGIDWRKQLSAEYYDTDRQTSVEISSGHGNSEEHRAWRAAVIDADGSAKCPSPTPATDGAAAYMPCCHRAGEIIRERCDDPQSSACAQKVATARQNYVDAGRGGARTIVDATAEDWQNCGQCEDCFQPAFNYRPGNSVQYQMAISNFDEPTADGRPLRFHYGFISSSDNHASQPGTGYKEVNRHDTTEAAGPKSQLLNELFFHAANPKGDPSRSQPFDIEASPYNFLQINESERQSSYFYSGGLVAVHSAGRDRRSIFDALKNRQVYGTSGPRMLLWFDMLDQRGNRLPMGSRIEQASTPRFAVTAVGERVQKPGCPDFVSDTLGEAGMQRLCSSECFNPGDEIRSLDRIEVIKITPQASPEEPVADLIEDPWLTLPCDPTAARCEVTFEDPGFASAGRDALYYVRAIQSATDAVNGGGLRCRLYDADGICRKVEPCYGDYRVDREDDCLAPLEERAWSSPIYVNHGNGTAGTGDNKAL